MMSGAAAWKVLILAILAGNAGAVEVRLSGMVYDSTGKGIMGARVGLARSGFSTRTDPKGAWIISASADSSLFGLPDTLVLGTGSEGADSDSVPVLSSKMTGIVTILSRLGKQSGVPRGGMPPPAASMRTGPQAPDEVAEVHRKRPEPKVPPEETEHVASKDSGFTALNWEHAVPTGSFVSEFSFRREVWVGTYGRFTQLFDEPRSYGYSLDVRYGIWEFDNGARSEIRMRSRYLFRNQDAGGNSGFAAPEASMQLGLTSWFGLEAILVPPLGGSRIVSDEPNWNYGGGFRISPRTERFQMEVSALLKADPGQILGRALLQVNFFKWMGAYLATDFDEGSKPMSEDVSNGNAYELLWIEPGLRLNLWRHLGLGLSVPWTIAGENQVGRWGLQATLRGSI